MRLPTPKAPWRLGLYLGAKANPPRHAYLGWAAIELDQQRNYDPVSEVEGVDPVAAAVATWEALPKPRPPAELYRFRTEADFDGSRAALGGMTLDQYRLMLAKAANALRRAGAEVIIVEATA